MNFLLAQAAGCEGYNQVASTCVPVHQTLPFTGLDVGLIVLVGIVLIIVGLLLRHVRAGDSLD